MVSFLFFDFKLIICNIWALIHVPTLFPQPALAASYLSYLYEALSIGTSTKTKQISYYYRGLSKLILIL